MLRPTAGTPENITGNVAASDLFVALDKKSADLDGYLLGKVKVRAVSGSLTATPSGTITVTTSMGVAMGSVPLEYNLQQNYPESLQSVDNHQL